MLAIDQASADAICAQPINAGTLLDELKENVAAGTDHWDTVHPSAEWKLQLEHAEELGIGTRAYDLVKVGH